MTRAATYLAWGGGGLLAAAFLAFDLGTATATVPRWLAVYALAACGLVWLVCTDRPKLDRLDMLALGFLGWAALSLTWAGDWQGGVLRWQNMAALFAVAWIFRNTRALDAALMPVMSLCILAAVGMALWRPEVYGGFGNDNFLAESLLLAVALVMVLPDDRRWAGHLCWLALLAGGGYLIWGTDSNQVWAVAAACLAWIPVVLWRGGMPVAALTVVSVAALMIGGLAMGGHFAPVWQSLVERAEIWINAAAMVLNNPIGGVGLGSFDYAYPRLAHLWAIDGSFLQEPTDYIGAAHNDVLQLVAELGLVGFVLAGGIARAIVSHSPGRGPSHQAATVVLFVALVTAFFGFPFQNPMSAVLIAVACGIAARSCEGRKYEVRWANLGGLLTIPLALSAFYYYQAAHIGRDIWRFMDKRPEIALAANIKAVELYPYDSWRRLQAMLTLASVLRKYPPDQVDLQPEAADRIYAMAESAVRDHPGVLLTRAEYLINSRRATPAEMDDLFRRMERTGSVYAETWALRAVWAGIQGDEGELQRSVMTAMDLPDGRRVFADMGFLQEAAE